MTHTALHAEFPSMTNKRSRRAYFSKNLYQVVVDGEEGEWREYEIEADSVSEASAIAEQLAADEMINIIYIEVYLYQ